MKRCDQCIESTSRVNRAARERYLATLPVAECDFCERLFRVRHHHNQACCSPECREQMIRLGREYTPMDVWENQPSTRVARVMRHRGWMSAEEIGDILGLQNGGDEMAARMRMGKAGRDPSHDHLRSRNSLSKVIERLAAAGVLERRVIRRPLIEYRLAPGLQSAYTYTPSQEYM